MVSRHACMCECIYVCAMYTYICVYCMYVCLWICTYVCVYVRIYIRMWVHERMYVYVYVRICVYCTYVCAYVHTYVRVYIRCELMYTCTICQHKRDMYTRFSPFQGGTGQTRRGPPHLRWPFSYWRWASFLPAPLADTPTRDSHNGGERKSGKL